MCANLQNIYLQLKLLPYCRKRDLLQVCCLEVIWIQKVMLEVVAQVLDAVMRYSDRTAGEEIEHLGQHVEVLSWAAAIDDTGHPCPSCLHLPGSGVCYCA